MIRATLVVVLSSGALAAFGQTPCENLKSFALANGRITEAEAVASGPFRPPAPEGRGGTQPGQPSALILPAYCRVAATLTPSTDSDIRMEVWLSAENWNGKIEVVGNGGWAGVISFPAMAQALKEGYAAASTDTGHAGGNGMFALGHPEKIVDFGYRAVHETVVKSKELIAAYYGKGPKFSYWNGCSTGGRRCSSRSPGIPRISTV